jgi:hypothetical protein
MNTTIFEEWRDGKITDNEALRALVRDLGEVESTLAPLENERSMLRDQISQVLERAGGKSQIAGFGKLELTPPSVMVNYDRKILDGILADLVERGDFELAQRITAARRESARSGSLRITREKQP